MAAAAAAAAAACGQPGAAVPAAVSARKPHANREPSRRNRENSRRRQAALLFLSNISLDGRPVHSQPAEHRHRDTETEPGLAAAECPELGTGSDMLLSCRAASSSCGSVNPCLAPKTGLLGVPPILVLPSDSGSNDPDSAEVLLGSRRGSFPSPGSSNLLSPSLSPSNSNLLSPSPSNSSLLPSPIGPRKSSTLLSVQSCNSVSSEPRQR